MRAVRALAATAPAGAIAFALMVVSVGLLGFAAYAGSNPAVANDARVAGDRERTRFIADAIAVTPKNRQSRVGS